MTGRTLVVFHPEAIAEARSARQWYEQRSKYAAAAFVAELDSAIGHIVETPWRWPQIDYGLRRYVLLRFPFSVIYQLRENAIQVIAVAHWRRRPGYWRRR